MFFGPIVLICWEKFSGENTRQVAYLKGQGRSGLPKLIIC